MTSALSLKSSAWCCDLQGGRRRHDGSLASERNERAPYEHPAGATSTQQYFFSILCCRTKHRKIVMKTALHVAVLCKAEGASVNAAVCHYKRARSALLLSRERSKFAKTTFDFWAPYKIGRNNVKAAPHGTTRCTRG